MKKLILYNFFIVTFFACSLSFAMNENNIVYEIDVLEKNIVKLMVPRNSKGFFSQQFGISEELIEEQDIPYSCIILDDDSKWVILMALVTIT